MRLRLGWRRAYSSGAFLIHAESFHRPLTSCNIIFAISCRIVHKQREIKQSRKKLYVY